MNLVFQKYSKLLQKVRDTKRGVNIQIALTLGSISV